MHNYFKKFIEKNLTELFNESVSELLSENYNNIVSYQKDLKNNTNLKIITIIKKENTIDNIFQEYEKIDELQLKKEFKKSGKILFLILKNDKIILINGDYDYVDEYPIHTKKNILISVIKNNKFGFIDFKGNLKIKPKYKAIYNKENKIVLFNNKYFFVCDENNNCGLINEEGKTIIPFEFIFSEIEFISNNNEELISIYNKNNHCIYSITNKKYIINSNEYSKIFIVKEFNNFIIKNINNYYGVINTDGKIIIDFSYSNITPIPELKLFQVSKNRKIGFFNSIGECIINIDYNKIIKINKNKSELTLMDKEKPITFNKHGQTINNGE
jgi:hypothetical protein